MSVKKELNVHHDKNYKSHESMTMSEGKIHQTRLLQLSSAFMQKL
jgi:hypothetical protein